MAVRPQTIRFPAHIARVIYEMAAREGKSHSELVREMVSREVARLEGRCPACRQPLPPPSGDSDDVTLRRRQVLARDGWRTP